MVEFIRKFGAYAFGILVFWSALRAVIKLRIYLNFLIFWCVRLRHTYVGVALRARNYSKIKCKINRAAR